ncbi:hypothetical protein ACA910_015044 [Epithemia clementina (nom. ined.)]
MNKYLVVAIISLIAKATAFTPTNVRQTRIICTSLDAYVPDGLSAEQYEQIRRQDKKRQGKDLGRLGPRGFKSRSMQAWQEAYEKGETGHAFAPFGYREQLKQGKIKLQDVPYMVRGGHWDNSDVFGALRLKWSKTDKEYAKGGYKKEQSVSVLGSGPGINWTGERRDEDRNYKRILPGFS